VSTCHLHCPHIIMFAPEHLRGAISVFYSFQTVLHIPWYSSLGTAKPCHCMSNKRCIKCGNIGAGNPVQTHLCRLCCGAIQPGWLLTTAAGHMQIFWAPFMHAVPVNINPCDGHSKHSYPLLASVHLHGSMGSHAPSELRILHDFECSMWASIRLLDVNSVVLYELPLVCPGHAFEGWQCLVPLLDKTSQHCGQIASHSNALNPALSMP
jgi:hypothetical protein